MRRTICCHYLSACHREKGGAYMKIPVGTSWEVPNGVETEVYVDIVLKYDLVDSVGNSFIAVLSI